MTPERVMHGVRRTETGGALFFSSSLFLFAGFLAGCASSHAVKTGYNPSQIRRLAVGEFLGQGGAVVAQEFVRQLAGTGLTVTDQPSTADAILSGSVTDYRPSDKMLVFLGSAVIPGSSGSTATVHNPIVSMNSAPVTTDGTLAGMPNTQVVAVSAEVGVVARVKDMRTGAMVWTGSFNYEALQISDAVQAVVSVLRQSLRQGVPLAAPAEHT